MTFWLPLILFLVCPVVLCLRGDGFHNHLIGQVADVFTEAGMVVSIEHPLRLPDGRTDYVDLWVTHRGMQLACEIETTARYVLVNTEKALMLGVPLWIIVPDRRLRMQIRRKVRKAFPHYIPSSPSVAPSGPGESDIRFLLVGEVPQAVRNHFPGFSRVNTPRKTGKTEKQTPDAPSRVKGSTPWN